MRTMVSSSLRLWQFCVILQIFTLCRGLSAKQCVGGW